MPREGQRRVWTVRLHPAKNAEREAGQATTTVFSVFGLTRPGIEPCPVFFSATDRNN